MIPVRLVDVSDAEGDAMTIADGAPRGTTVGREVAKRDGVPSTGDA